MSFFKRDKQSADDAIRAKLAELALATIQDGIIITNQNGVVQFINHAALAMVGAESPDQVVGLDYGLFMQLESKERRELTDAENPLVQAIRSDQPLQSYVGCLLAKNTARYFPVSISVLSSDGFQPSRIITLHDATNDLAKESEQAEFISTASHEMRTPVASIEGYLSLAINPQTATIDDRARQYLTAAHAASQHLGRLFRDLLDATKLDDGHVKAHFEPIELVGSVKQIVDGHIMAAREAGLTLQFGAGGATSSIHHLSQVVYGYVDMDFLREVVDNLVDNAIKYTPKGGSIYVNVLGDGDRALINVTDTGIGISANDIHHIFQKFYRADNSDTRTIGGTGLGLYLVKQRAEAMGGKVWAESAFGEGSTFFVSLPRLTDDEYEKRMIAVRNAGMAAPTKAPAANPPLATPLAPAPTTAPTTATTTTATTVPTPAPTPAPTPTSTSAPTPTSVPTPTLTSAPAPAPALTPAPALAPTPTPSAVPPQAAPAIPVSPPPSPPTAPPALNPPTPTSFPTSPVLSNPQRPIRVTIDEPIKWPQAAPINNNQGGNS